MICKSVFCVTRVVGGNVWKVSLQVAHIADLQEARI